MAPRLLLLLLCLLPSLACSPQTPRSQGPLPQHAYVWQRAWTPAVRDAVRTRGPAFDRLVLLAAEVTWQGDEAQVAWVSWDVAALRGRPVGIAVRVSPRPGGLQSQPAAEALRGVALAALQRARAAGLEVAELQMDYDEGTAHLSDYATFLADLRPRLGQVPLTVTALPTWLGSRKWPDLVGNVDGFVLQVHALVAPAGPDRPAQLCDPAAARAAVERAGQLGKPFRVALPTYAYGVAFDPSGRLLGLVAEGPPPRLPTGGRWQELSPEPGEIVALLRAWTADRPAALQGIAWFRLPVDGERRNWTWPALQAVRQLEVPRPNLQVRVVAVEDGSLELRALNTGQVAGPLPRRVTVLAGEVPIVAADALEPYVRAERSGLVLVRQSDVRLQPGAERTLGWLRLARPAQVEVTHEL